MNKFWLVSVYADPDLRWSDTCFMVGAESAQAAATAIIHSDQFDEWWDGRDMDDPATAWVVPMREPEEDEVSRVDPERKYQAEEFECLWDFDREVEVRLGDSKPSV